MGAESIATGMGMALVDNAINQGNIKHNAQMSLDMTKDLNKFNQGLAYDMWNKTNYEAQVGHMKRAGLNIAQMYGGGGNSGTTNTPTGSVSAGSSEMKGAQSMAMMMQNQMMDAQIKNIEADTELKKADANKKGGVETELGYATIENLRANTKTQEGIQMLNKADYRLKDIQATIGENTMEEAQSIIISDARKALAEAGSAEIKKDVDKATQQDVIDMIKAQSIGAVLENALTRVKTEEGKQAIIESKELVKKIQNDIKISKGQLDLNKWNETVKANYPNILNVLGGKVDQVIRGIQNIISGGSYPTERKYGE